MDRANDKIQNLRGESALLIKMKERCEFCVSRNPEMGVPDVLSLNRVWKVILLGTSHQITDKMADILFVLLTFSTYFNWVIPKGQKNAQW